MNELLRLYDSLDMRALRALLEYEGCPQALEEDAQGWHLDKRKARNLLFRDRGSLDWLDLLTVPLWREIVAEFGEEHSERALRFVAETLLKKSTLLEADMDRLLAEQSFVYIETGSICERFVADASGEQL